MADDNGLIADIENAIVAELASIKLTGDTVFRTADNWRFQVTGEDLSAWKRYVPFAFVKYAGTPHTSIEGDHDLNQHLYFSILVGQAHSRKTEGPRIGTGTDAHRRELGISRMRDLVITELQNLTPAGITSGDVEFFEFLTDAIEVDVPNYYAISMRFRIDRTGSY